LKIFKEIKIQSKLYFSAALIFVAVLGSILGQHQITLPNQEIVLQFANEDVSLNDTQQTVAIVEQELKRIGVSSIHVGEQEDGRLVISYYSTTDVKNIKKLLSAQKDLALGFISSTKNEIPLPIPTKDTSIVYQLDVYEIKDGQNSYSSLGGQCAVELKTAKQRFLNPNLFIASQEPFFGGGEPILKVDFSFQRSIGIVKDYRSHKIPEVRAGPLS